MKYKLSAKVFSLLVLVGGDMYSQNAPNCAKEKVRVDSLISIGKEFAQKQQFITTESYFKAAEDICQKNESCFPLGSTFFKEEYISAITASTYQKLLEKVIDQQDNNEYAEATKTYLLAEKYFYSNGLSTLGLKHELISDFAFNKCKGGFAKYLSDYFIEKNELDLALGIFKGLLDRKMDPEQIKRPLYDLGGQFAIREKKKNPNANAKELSESITSNRSDLAYFRKGFAYYWKGN